VTRFMGASLSREPSRIKRSVFGRLFLLRHDVSPC
jgi:hypothetical protein